MARTTLLNEELKARLVSAAEAVFHYKYVAGLCGISPDSLENYRKQDEDLSARLDQARSRYVHNHMRKAKPEFMLQAADREIFGQKAEVEVKGGDNPIRVLLQAYGIDPNKISEGITDDQQNDGALPEAPQNNA
jgi:hypothetical protein